MFTEPLRVSEENTLRSSPGPGLVSSRMGFHTADQEMPVPAASPSHPTAVDARESVPLYMYLVFRESVIIGTSPPGGGEGGVGEKWLLNIEGSFIGVPSSARVPWDDTPGRGTNLLFPPSAFPAVCTVSARVCVSCCPG